MRRRAAPGDGRSSPKERSPSRHARRERHPSLTPDDLPNDFEETVLETFHETETEAQITMILAELPDDVIKAIEDYETAHSVDRDRLLELATLARLSQFLTRNSRKWLILRTRYGANTLRLSPQIDFDRGKFGVVVAQVKTSRDDGG
jgi:hypothetical protein